MEHVYNDGGRAAAGFKGSTGDCVVRAICIISGLPYRQVYDDLFTMQSAQRKTKRLPKGARYIRNGTYTNRKWFKDYMASLDFVWTPTMLVGQGCKVHLTPDELPAGKLIVSLSRHYTSVIDGVIYDTHNPNDKPTGGWWNSYEGTDEPRGPRCVYGYWQKAK